VTPPGPPRLRALGVPRLDCSHASACCSSYSVGPLLPDDVLRVQAALPAVRRAWPDQPLDDPLLQREHAGQPATFLNKVDGFCCFWQPDVGCTIHQTVGGEVKPLVCQLFPLQLLDTDDGLRIGVRPTCLTDHLCWERGPQVDGAFIERLVGDSRSALRREAPDGEETALRLASFPDLDTASIVAFLAGTPRTEPPPIESWLEGRLAAVFDEIDAIGAVGPCHPRTVTAGILAEIRAWQAVRDDAGSWPEVPEAGLPWFRDALGRLIFLRQTTLHPSLAWALLAYVAAARWAAGWAAADGWSADRFGRGFSTLLIVLENPRLQRSLVAAGVPFSDSRESQDPRRGPTDR
jgi:hypothetical protein